MERVVFIQGPAQSRSILLIAIEVLSQEDKRKPQKEKVQRRRKEKEKKNNNMSSRKNC
jgi:hypothetical protein